MLELHGANTPKRLQFIRIQRIKNPSIHSQSVQLKVLDKITKIEPNIPLPSERSFQSQKKKSQKSNKSTFNVCQSKNVFVFAKMPNSTKKVPGSYVPVDRKLWSSPQKLGADAEVFLPHSSKKNYRLTARTSQGTRQNNKSQCLKRQISSSQNPRHTRLEPEPWDLDGNLNDFDHLF